MHCNGVKLCEKIAFSSPLKVEADQDKMQVLQQKDKSSQAQPQRLLGRPAAAVGGTSSEATVNGGVVNVVDTLSAVRASEDNDGNKQ